MPLFDFECRKCGHVFEELLSSSAVAIVLSCPQCGSKETDKQIGSFSVGASAESRRAEAAADGPSCGRCGEQRAPCSE